MTTTLAVFRTPYGHSTYGDATFETWEGYVRQSEYVEVSFPPRPVEEQTKEELNEVDRQINLIRSKALQELERLAARKAELLQLPTFNQEDLTI